jgi:hypothetical protein
MGRAWVLPEGEGCALYAELDGASYRAQGTEVRRVGPVAVPIAAPWAVDPGRDVLCWAEGRHVWVQRGALVDSGRPAKKIALPRGTEVHALLLHDEVLYVGGRGSKEIVGFLDLRADRPAFEAMEVPPQLLQWAGKSIDAFVRDGETLVAVDDIMLPKWFLLYDVSAPRQPRFVEAPELSPHSTGEVFHAAALSDRHLALVSTSMNHGRSAVHLALYQRGTLREVGALHARARKQWLSQDPEGREFAHVDALGEMLLLSAGLEGLGVASLHAIEAAPTAATQKTFSSRFTGLLRWIRFEGLSVVRAFAVDPARALVSLSGARGRHEVRLVDLAPR